MAYVSVPKDLTKVKNKVAFNLTKRQLICIGIGAAMGIPSYFLLRNVMGNSNAATVMVLLMLPAFLFAISHVIVPCIVIVSIINRIKLCKREGIDSDFITSTTKLSHNIAGKEL